MRRLLFVMFFAALVFTTIFDYADAATVLYKSFGGRITTMTKSNVTCKSGQGPVSLVNAKKSDFLDYLISEDAENVTPANKAAEGSWILGWRLATTDFSTCSLDTYPYPPYPVNSIRKYGVSSGYNLSI